AAWRLDAGHTRPAPSQHVDVHGERRAVAAGAEAARRRAATRGAPAQRPARRNVRAHARRSERATARRGAAPDRLARIRLPHHRRRLSQRRQRAGVPAARRGGKDDGGRYATGRVQRADPARHRRAGGTMSSSAIRVLLVVCALAVCARDPATWSGEGDLRAVEQPGPWLTIEHDDIPDVLPASTTRILARAPEVARDVAPGMRVRFDLTRDGGRLVV